MGRRVIAWEAVVVAVFTVVMGEMQVWSCLAAAAAEVSSIALEVLQETEADPEDVVAAVAAVFI